MYNPKFKGYTIYKRSASNKNHSQWGEMHYDLMLRDIRESPKFKYNQAGLRKILNLGYECQ